jgi:microcystin-dependent protein
MSAPFVAEIKIFAGNFAPTGYAQCNGQLMPISQNTALFSLLGTFYGGDGKSTFALPNLQGSAPLGQGDGAGLSQRFLGEQSGSEFVTLIQSEMPVHTHNIAVSSEQATQGTPTANVVLSQSQNGQLYQTTTNANIVLMNVQSLSVNGGSLPHNNMQPYLTLTYIIALQGIFPARP